MWVGIYTMENKDTNIDYQKFFSLEDQKWEIVENTFGITFLFEIYIHYFLCRQFSKPTWKKPTPATMPIPTQNHNFA